MKKIIWIYLIEYHQRYIFSRILLSHRDKVFPKLFNEGDMPPGLNVNMSYLYWTNFLNDKDRIKDLDKKAQEENENDSDETTDEEEVEDDIFNIASRIEQVTGSFQKFLGEDIKRLASYSLVQLGRTNPELKDCLTSESLEYNDFLAKDSWVGKN